MGMCPIGNMSRPSKQACYWNLAGHKWIEYKNLTRKCKECGIVQKYDQRSQRFVA